MLSILFNAPLDYMKTCVAKTHTHAHVHVNIHAYALKVVCFVFMHIFSCFSFVYYKKVLIFVLTMAQQARRHATRRVCPRDSDRFGICSEFLIFGLPVISWKSSRGESGLACTILPHKLATQPRRSSVSQRLCVVGVSFVEVAL